MSGERPGEDPAAAMKEMRDLGVDVLRTNVLFYRVYQDYHRPDEGRPASTPRPRLAAVHALGTDRPDRQPREANGIKLLFTVSGPGPLLGLGAAEQVPRQRHLLVAARPRSSASSPRRSPSATAARSTGTRSTTSRTSASRGPGWMMPQSTRTRRAASRPPVSSTASSGRPATRRSPSRTRRAAAACCSARSRRSASRCRSSTPRSASTPTASRSRAG